jgi:lysozyme family protein
MSDAIDDLITDVLKREGGFVNNSADRGGATKYGITQGTLAAWRKAPVSVAQVQALTEEEARKIYRANYFAGIDGVTDSKVLGFLFDYSVNSGPRRAVKALQTVLGVTPDGDFGPASKAALARVKQADLYGPLICERLDFYLRIIANDPSQVVFAAGWANRIKPFWERKAA